MYNSGSIFLSNKPIFILLEVCYNTYPGQRAASLCPDKGVLYACVVIARDMLCYSRYKDRWSGAVCHKAASHCIEPLPAGFAFPAAGNCRPAAACYRAPGRPESPGRFAIQILCNALDPVRVHHYLPYHIGQIAVPADRRRYVQAIKFASD